MDEAVRVVREDDLFYLRAVAAEWLKTNQQSPNAKPVTDALSSTNEPTKSAYKKVGQV